MRSNHAAAETIRALISAVPDNRLRELFLELALTALAVPAVEEPKPAARNARRRRARGKGCAEARASTGRPPAPCLSRHAQRQAPRETTAGHA